MSLGRPRISIIPADAVTDSSLEGRDLQVLALLGRHTDNRGWCCRSQVKMAKELGCGRATVQRSITRLVSAGYLQLRVKVRDSGADAAHEYRVVLDRPDFDEAVETDADAAAATEGAHKRAGVPTGGQGCPRMDGQGVPTYERAPMLTIPVKRTRESAREDEKEFERARRAWPSGFADSRDDALAAWLDLSPEDRRDAYGEITRFADTNKSIGRKLICGFASYLREQRWKALPPRPKPAPVAAASEPRVLPRPRPTAFQRAKPHLYPELFGDPTGSNQDGAQNE
ncbi:MAG: helix-turn-helix domain-containing protein [Mesorhizobium sp.]|uniref:helix-turn-helix domain-containing protein n=1 Tax=Mesorhizobium sp. TaxID=1871066 RepID=UPI000FE88592|nr:helix-turn-helix domain-containing protein [Mesorhizobium sp.]RWD50395.1 MAG: helix-turn-helix domain-containing protein [Mesorhizobium sp.]RWE62850.1 MAG: helix-turn-helix domain-containing protein [Mesorhizobium sp.]RWF10447.1 MAG: helix-turn-helix domain-containing protein [Mesorhizobium sp.]RWF20672.1 MAG: helix-turn-helix domain-containing protein [Mesorhizobium sp.]